MVAAIFFPHTSGNPLLLYHSSCTSTESFCSPWLHVANFEVLVHKCHTVRPPSIPVKRGVPMRMDVSFIPSSGYHQKCLWKEIIPARSGLSTERSDTKSNRSHYWIPNYHLVPCAVKTIILILESRVRAGGKGALVRAAQRAEEDLQQYLDL